MKNAKKIFSFALAVVMLLSTLSVAGFALTAERNDYANVKYSVSKTDVIEYNGEKIDLSATDLAGDIYALTISVKAAYGINYLQIPYYFNLDKFGVLCEYYSLDEIYWNTDNYYADWGVDVNPGYTMGPAWSDAGAYNAAGDTATGRNIMCYGLANTNAANQYTITSKVFDPSTPGYDLWTAGISKDFTVGGGFFTIQCTFTKAKASYINVVNGKVVTDDYVDIYTCYLYNHTGDPIGEEIGAFTEWEKDSVNNIQVAWDDSYSTGTTPRNSYIAGSSKTETTSWASFVENAVIAKETAPELSISWFKDQVRYNDDSFDYRTVYKIDNFSEIFADLNDGSNRIIDAGFVFSTEEAIDVDAAKEQVESWKATADGKNITFDVMNYSAATRCYVSTTFTGADYAFACLVKDIPNSVGEGEDANLSALGYIIYEDAEGNTAYAYYDYTLDVDALYKQYK